MKRISKKIKVTHRRTFLVANGSAQIRCRECSQEAWMMRAETASGITGVAIRTIYQHVEAGRVHFQETPDGFLMVCLNSLNSLADGIRRKNEIVF